LPFESLGDLVIPAFKNDFEMTFYCTF